MTVRSNLSRRPLVADLLARRGSAAVIAGLGNATWDIFAAGDDDLNLYSWGAMGMAAPTALGLALAQPLRRILAITGDGEMMMGVGSLATIAAQQPSNLAILVLDNESFGETGRQDGLTGQGVDLAAMALAAGFATARIVRDGGDMPLLASLLFEEPGPVMAVAKIPLTDDPLLLPPRDGALVAGRMRAALGGR